MKYLSLHSLIAVIALSTSQSSAWTTNTQISSLLSSSSTSKLQMGSKAASKWEKKKEWLEKRGMNTDTGLALASSGTVESGFCTVIGGGRIGSMLMEGGESLLLRRGDSIPEENEGTPILVATRNDSLNGIIDACPENRKKDLVFMQNGYLDDFLSSKGLLDNTQVLLFVSVTALGAEPIDGITSANPEGLTSAMGIHAEAFQSRLAALGLKCNVVSSEGYRPAMFEKLIWISTYMLVGAARECSSVGQAGSEHGELVEQVVNELLAAVSAKEGITFEPGALQRLAAYTDVVADFPCAVKEFEWRNQYFYNLGDDACPIHNGLLRECAEKGFIGFQLP